MIRVLRKVHFNLIFFYPKGLLSTRRVLSPEYPDFISVWISQARTGVLMFSCFARLVSIVKTPGAPNQFVCSGIKIDNNSYIVTIHLFNYIGTLIQILLIETVELQGLLWALDGLTRMLCWDLTPIETWLSWLLLRLDSYWDLPPR